MPSRALWSDTCEVERFPPLAGPARYDTVVIGAGLSGLAAAVLLARAGQRCGVLESRRIGAGTTGHSTAKVSLLQGTRLSRLRQRHSVDVVSQYVAANRFGQTWLVELCRDHGVDADLRDACTYATTSDGEERARHELEAARDAGLPVTRGEEVGLPFVTRGGVRLAGQAQFDPMAALGALAQELRSLGGVIHEVSPVTGVGRGGVVRTSSAEVTGGHVVVATGAPILDRAAQFARLVPHRSYAAAFVTPAPLPEAMYLSAEEPTRSIRTAGTASGTVLLVGGNGHVVGRHGSPRRLLDDLTQWVHTHFHGARRTHWWSAQDYRTMDGLPFAGPILPGSRVLVTTGYDKWGMTNAVAAAQVVAGRILGEPPPWANVMDT